MKYASFGMQMEVCFTGVILVVALVAILALLPKIGEKINETEEKVVAVTTEEEF